jgi:hypothetical protein
MLLLYLFPLVCELSISLTSNQGCNEMITPADNMIQHFTHLISLNSVNKKSTPSTPGDFSQIVCTAWSDGSDNNTDAVIF